MMGGLVSQQAILIWQEIRIRLLFCAAVLGAVFLVLGYFANSLYTYFASPLLKYLPQHHLISTQLIASVFAPFKLAFFWSWILCTPVFFWHLWHFIAPALYRDEKKWLWSFLSASILLFYLGLIFAFYFIFPALFHFLVMSAPQGVEVLPDMNIYLDFSIRLLLMFGGLFEIPLIICALILFGLVTREQCEYFRPYAVIGAFVLGMLIAPPDVLSQTLLAVPIYLLFESGIFFSRWISFNRLLLQAETEDVK